MSDDFASAQPSIAGPIVGGVAITPHNTTELAKTTRALYVGVAGDVTALMADGTVVTYKAVPVGVWPFRVRRINATATTATDMVGLY